MKKFLLALMMACACVFGFVSCYDGNDDDDEVTITESNYYGEYMGALTVGTSSYDVEITITEDGLSYTSGAMPRMSGSYTNVSYDFDDDSNVVLSCYAEDDTDQETAKVTVTFGDTVTFTVVAMGASASLTNMDDLLGSYTGSLTVYTNSYAVAVTIDEESLSYSSSDMPRMTGTYTNIAYSLDDDNNIVLSCYADDDTDMETAKVTVTFGDIVTFTVVAMGASATLTKAE